jgi:hypothetical protein
MTQIVSVSIPDEIYREIKEKRKVDKEKWRWSHVFRVGFMRLNSDTLSDEIFRAESTKKIERLTQKLEFYAQKSLEMEAKVIDLEAKK